jgi:hypothetical protein
MTDTLYLDNGGSSGTGYFSKNFALQLQGPFNAGVCTEFHRLPLSETSFRRLLVLITAFVYKVVRIIRKYQDLSRIFGIVLAQSSRVPFVQS